MIETKSISERIQKTSKVLGIIIKVSKIICCISIGVFAIGIIYVMFFGNADLLVLNGDVILHSPFSSDLLQQFNSKELILIEANAIVKLAFLIVIFEQARQIFNDFSTERTPFEMKHVKRIRKIAIFYMLISLLDFETKGGTEALSFSLNIMGIVGAAMFWCISIIFEYGCELQKESDETL